jgi:hypothetical protein
VKIDFAINYYNNPNHVAAAWSTGVSDPAVYPNASVGFLVLTVSEFGAASFVNGSNTNATGINFSNGGFTGLFNWAPNANTTVSGIVASRSVWVHAVDSASGSTVDLNWAAGFSFKILIFSFEGFRPSLVYWDPVFGSNINYAVVDQQANPTAQTSAKPTSANPTSANPTQSVSSSSAAALSSSNTAVQSSVSGNPASTQNNSSSASNLLANVLLALACIMALF